MNDTSTSNLVEHRWDEAVKNYVPRLLTKWKKLVSLLEGILELRRNTRFVPDHRGNRA
jgi:hypothetical protein